MVICLERGANGLHNGPADATATPSSLASLNLSGAVSSRIEAVAILIRIELLLVVLRRCYRR